MEVVSSVVHVVREYIDMVETLEGVSAHSFLSRCAVLLPQIYAFGQQLPDSDLSKNEADDANPVKIDSPILKLQTMLGKFDSYFEVFDPLMDKETLSMTLSDDLSDIYLDLKKALVAYDNGHHNEALWEWKFDIQGHCGEHIVDALRPIHRLVYDHMRPEYTSSDGGA